MGWWASDWRLRWVVLTGVLLLGWSSAFAADPRTVILQLLWTHQGYNGGFYIADRQGLYAKEGLRLSFLEGGPDVDLIAPVLDGRAEFGIAEAADLIAARAKGAPVRAIATIFRRTPTVYVSKVELGITSPADFAGHTIRVSTVDEAAFLALMRRQGIPFDRFRIVRLPSDPAVFGDGPAQVWAIYVNNTALTLERAGYKLNYVYPDDYSVHFYADTLFTTDTLADGNPDLALRFLRASLRGWAIAVEEPATVGALMPFYDPKADPSLETLKMEATQSLVNTGEDRIGWMREQRWADMVRDLGEEGLLAGPVHPSDLFTLRYLREAYDGAR